MPSALISSNIICNDELDRILTVSESQQNYTEEQTKQLLVAYAELGPDSLEQLSTMFSKSVRSIRSKLVKEKVYVAPSKKTVKKLGTSKKELLRSIEERVGFDTTGFTGSTKQALADLIVYLDSNKN